MAPYSNSAAALRRALAAAAAICAAAALPGLVRAADTPDAAVPSATAAPAAGSAATAEAARNLALRDRGLPDDVTTSELLTRAIDLRRREDFDRMLDAYEPGELIEHATLNDIDFDNRKLGVDTLFVVGDELFAYLFRPENGWGGKGRRIDAIDYTPSPRRIHDGLKGGPDAFACASCHSKGGPDGAGTGTQNAFLRGDGVALASADQRNPPHMLGLGPVELLGREMSSELAAEAKAAADAAKKGKRAVDKPLVTKGVSFGTITSDADGKLDYSKIQGVDPDLVIKPFGWKGHQATLRAMIEESLQIHQGLLSKRIQLAIKDGTLDRGPYGNGPWYDVDEDGVSLEIDSGMLTTVVGYLAQLEVPVIRPPHDAQLLDLFAAGRRSFETIGCASCHVPSLDLKDPKLNAADGVPNAPAFLIDLSKDGDQPKVEPRYASPTTSYIVHLFSDLKRHDMGPSLASPAAQGAIAASVFLTRPLWGLAETAPYLHDGRAPTIQDAIVMHGGEAKAARDAYLALDENGKAGVRVFLASLSRQPKLFLP